jgi:hypothetical protein
MATQCTQCNSCFTVNTNVATELFSMFKSAPFRSKCIKIIKQHDGTRLQWQFEPNALAAHVIVRTHRCSHQFRYEKSEQPSVKCASTTFWLGRSSTTTGQTGTRGRVERTDGKITPIWSLTLNNCAIFKIKRLKINCVCTCSLHKKR